MPLVFLIGLCLVTYPSLSDYWNSYHQTKGIMSYAKSVSKMSDKEYNEILSRAEDYNKRLTSMNWDMTDAQKKDYESQLNFNHDGSMGYISIPKINIKLGIYHGTDDKVLQTSIGHLAGTSLPVGGKGTHCVLSGHRGLPSAKLFSDLDKLREGDTFTIHVLNETLTYEVDQIRVVEPTDFTDLTIDPNQDYLTLVTCTPYGVNTQRLLVRGHRIPNANGGAKVISDALQLNALYIAPFIAVPICFLIVAYIFYVTSRHYLKTHGDKVGQYLEEKRIERLKMDSNNYQSIIKQLKKYFKDN
ncbi:sortase A [Streptococcus equinus]|uniref:Sortase A n=2 Tax=Streptococcus equinus TaxID=1335 RepID=A0A1H0PFY3_STREI|nr:sortase A [Streptococcus equinus]